MFPSTRTIPIQAGTIVPMVGKQQEPSCRGILHPRGLCLPVTKGHGWAAYREPAVSYQRHRDACYYVGLCPW